MRGRLRWVNHDEVVDWVLQMPGQPAKGDFEACWRLRYKPPVDGRCDFAREWFAKKPYVRP